MKRSRLLALFLLLAFIFIGWHWMAQPIANPSFSEDAVAPLATPLSASLPANDPLPPQVLVKTLPTPQARVATFSTGAYSPELHQKQLKDKGLVEVRTVNGMALVQGDILLGKLAESGPSSAGQAVASEVHYWSSPEIPYAIQPDISPQQKLKIEAALNYFKEKTPVHFVPYDAQSDAIVFEVGNEHCISPLGKIGGLQPIRLDKNCGTHEVLHEVMHALGFPHEQSRTDRDQSVEILWNNIDPQFTDQFLILPDAWMAAVKDSPFDPSSVMMYPVNIFTRGPELPSMRSLTAQAIEPVPQGLSTQDIERLKRLFSR